MWKQLKPKQQQAVLKFMSQRRLCLFFEQRTGKTYVTLGIIDQLEPDDVLLVVPLTNKETTWSTKLEEFLPQYTICRTWPEFKAAKGQRIFLIHYDALRSVIRYVCKRQWGLVVFDESQRLKARASAASRAANRLRTQANKLLLSGTPMDGKEIDIWAQMRFVNEDVLGLKWASFVRRYCKKTGYKGYKIKFRDNLRGKFLAALEPWCIRVTKEDVGIVRARQHIIPVHMFGAQLRSYREMEREGVTRINGARSMAPMTMTKLIRCHQIASGFIATDDGEIHHVGRAKERKLRQLISPNKFPIVVFCKYREEMKIIEAVLREFSNSGAILSGAVKDRKIKKPRTEMIQALQRGDLDWLICQIRTGGVGTDLYTARQAIVYSMAYSFIDHDQMISRLESYDQDGVAEFFLLVCRNTVDEDIVEAISSKRVVTEVVMDRLRRRS